VKEAERAVERCERC